MGHTEANGGTYTAPLLPTPDTDMFDVIRTQPEWNDLGSQWQLFRVPNNDARMVAQANARVVYGAVVTFSIGYFNRARVRMLADCTACGLIGQRDTIVIDELVDAMLDISNGHGIGRCMDR